MLKANVPSPLPFMQCSTTALSHCTILQCATWQHMAVLHVCTSSFIGVSGTCSAVARYRLNTCEHCCSMMYAWIDHVARALCQLTTAYRTQSLFNLLAKTAAVCACLPARHHIGFASRLLVFLHAVLMYWSFRLSSLSRHTVLNAWPSFCQALAYAM